MAKIITKQKNVRPHSKMYYLMDDKQLKKKGRDIKKFRNVYVFLSLFSFLLLADCFVISRRH